MIPLLVAIALSATAAPTNDFIGPEDPYDPGNPEAQCSCYYSVDCEYLAPDDPASVSCTGPIQPGSFCYRQGKYDGECVVQGTIVNPPDEKLPQSTIDSIKQMFELWQAVPGAFVESHEAIGTPSPSDWRTALRTAATPKQQAIARAIVHNSLDVSIGFDLEIPHRPTGDHKTAREPSWGNIHGVPDAPQMSELIEATKDAVVSALETGHMDTSKLESFFSEYPDYTPNHLGRCYDHGHHDAPEVSPLHCIEDELVGRLNAAVSEYRRSHLKKHQLPGCIKCQ